MAKKISIAPEQLTEEGEQRAAIFVAIEWDGNKPPATFYNRLHQYGLYSRRSLEEKNVAFESDNASLYHWRSTQNGKKKTETMSGLVLQEGMILVNSASMAEFIMYEAKRLGAKHVIVGNLSMSDFAIGEQDLRVLDQMHKVVSKRGPKKSAEEGRYVVTCYDEARTYEVLHEAQPIQCPMCNSVKIEVRSGKQYTFTHDPKETNDKGDVTAYWSRTRFAGSNFEVPVFVSLTKGKPLAPFPPIEFDKKAFINIIASLDIDTTMNSNWYNDIWRNGTDAIAMMHLLDVMYCAAKKNKAQRKLERVKVIIDYFASEGENDYDFSVPEKVDIIDLVQIDRSYAKYL